MDPATSDCLAQRVEGLERTVRFFRAGAVLLGLSLVAVFLTAQVRAPLPSLVEAEAFLLKDRGGVVRAALHVDSAGAARLVLSDSTGVNRVVASSDGPLVVLDDPGDRHSLLRATGLTLLSGQNVRADLTLGSNGLPALLLYNAAGLSAGIMSSVSGSGGLVLGDAPAK
jgi:hypothetical protein